jgi:hypothetical protein
MKITAIPQAHEDIEKLSMLSTRLKKKLDFCPWGGCDEWAYLSLDSQSLRPVDKVPG